MLVETKDLGLAAFIMMKGYRLIGCDNRVFKFECDGMGKRELEIEYANSCCKKHDGNVMYLRTLL